MAVLTEFQGAVIGGSAESPILTLPPTVVLNSFGSPQSIDSYNVQDDASGPTTVVAGDFLAPVVGGTPIPGEYRGSGTLSTAGLQVGQITNGGFLNSNTGVGITINSVDVDWFVDEAGNVYLISDEPLTADRINANLVVKLPAAGPVSVTVPISQLGSTLASLDPLNVLGPLLGGTTNLVQTILDTAVVSLTLDPNGQLILDPDDIDIVCFARGTMILTEAGPVAVEDLRAGDMVVTRDNGPQPLRWIGSQAVSARMLRAVPRLTPVRIRAGALGDGLPEADLIVSPQHRVLVRSRIAQRMFGTAEVLVAAKQLLMLDGFELATDLAEVEYFHIMFDRHEVVLSNGAETESLFTGPQALRMVGPAARQELMTLFPDLAAPDHRPVPARDLAPGRTARHMAERHARNARALVG